MDSGSGGGMVGERGARIPISQELNGVPPALICLYQRGKGWDGFRWGPEWRGGVGDGWHLYASEIADLAESVWYISAMNSPSRPVQGRDPTGYKRGEIGRPEPAGPWTA